MKKYTFKTFTSFLIGLFMMLSVLCPFNMVSAKDSVESSNDKDIKNINIVTFNDFHGSVKESGKNVGLAKFAATIKKFKENNPNTVVVAAGDLYQGSALSNLNYGAPVNEMLKNIGVTASAVGNHEFDWGIDRIKDWAKEGDFDWLASNIYEKSTGEPVAWAKPYKMVEVDGVKIGLIGLATPETAYKTKPTNVKTLEFRDPAKAAKEWTTKLKSGELKEGKADVVIALTHIGSIQDAKTKEIKGEAADVAKANVGLDAIISAHTHMKVCGEVNNVPIIQASKYGRAYGTLNIKFNTNTKKALIKPTVVDLSSKVKELKEDKEGKEILNKYEKNSESKLGEVVGTTDKDLTHERFAGPSLLGEWVCEAMAKEAKTQIAITNGGGLRCPIEKGNITVGKMYELMPFDNTLVTMEIKGSDLKKVFENGIGNEKIGWVAISGVKIKYDLKRPFRDRIVNMTLDNGEKIDSNKYYTVTTNDFMSVGGDGYDFSKARNIVDTHLPIRDGLINQLKVVKNLSVTRKGYLQPGKAISKPEVKPDKKSVKKPAKKPIVKPVNKRVVYTVKSGDCLYNIGRKYKVSYMKIAKENNIKNPNIIFVGQKLVINL